jgi:lipooligosaccharide transport system permease protein
MLIAFGIGLGGYVASLSWQGRPIEYMTYVAPGLLAYATFMTAIFQSLFGAFIRMRYQRTWEGQLTTQIELTHVIWGEVLWAGLLATMYVVIVAAVLAGFHAAGLIRIAVVWLPALLPVSFVAACAFGALGLGFTALLPTIDHRPSVSVSVMPPVRSFASSFSLTILRRSCSFSPKDADSVLCCQRCKVSML